MALPDRSGSDQIHHSVVIFHRLCTTTTASPDHQIKRPLRSDPDRLAYTVYVGRGMCGDLCHRPPRVR